MEKSRITNFKQKLVSENWNVDPEFSEKLITGEKARCSHPDGLNLDFFIKKSMVCGGASSSGDYLFHDPIEKEYITSEKWQ